MDMEQAAKPFGDEETKRLIRLAQNGDEDAKSRLIAENSPLVWSIVRKFRGRYETEDLYQIGVIGLLKCINKFDLNFDVRFSTYAVPMIMGEIKRFLRDDGMLKVSRPLKELGLKAKYAADELRKRKLSEPTITEVARELGTTVGELIMAMESTRDVESIYSAVYQNDGNPVYLIDRLPKGGEDMLDSITIREAINSLPPKEKKIITLRYFRDKTQQEVAKEVGISQVQVSRIEKKVLNSMRKKL